MLRREALSYVALFVSLVVVATNNNGIPFSFSLSSPLSFLLPLPPPLAAPLDFRKKIVCKQSNDGLNKFYKNNFLALILMTVQGI